MNVEFLNKIMSKLFENPHTDCNKLTIDELLKLRDESLELIRKSQVYTLRNDAKIRACLTSESYDEFKYFLLLIIKVFLSHYW